MKVASSLVFVVGALAAGAVSAQTREARLEVTSPAFNNNEAMPKEYTCQGTELSPPLRWANAPAETKSFAILVEDPDAPKGTFTHWVVTGIPATARGLDSGAALPQGAAAGGNDWGKRGYSGPCPPYGNHRYVFRVFALDKAITRPVRSRAQLESAIKGHVIAEGQLVGTYRKQ